MKSFAAATLIACFGMGANAQSIKTPAPRPTQTVTQAFGLGEIKIEYFMYSQSPFSGTSAVW